MRHLFMSIGFYYPQMFWHSQCLKFLTQNDMIYTIKGFPKVNEQYAYFKPIVQGFFPHFSKVQQKAFCRMTLPKSPVVC